MNQLRFVDESGNVVRLLTTREENLIHTNLDTGYTLHETVHYITDVDRVANEVEVVGNHWHLRDADGNRVVFRSGLEIVDLLTFDTVKHTPQVGAGYENVICPALGGNPA